MLSVSELQYFMCLKGKPFTIWPPLQMKDVLRHIPSGSLDLGFLHAMYMCLYVWWECFPGICFFLQWGHSGSVRSIMSQKTSFNVKWSCTFAHKKYILLYIKTQLSISVLFCNQSATISTAGKAAVYYSWPITLLQLSLHLLPLIVFLCLLFKVFIPHNIIRQDTRHYSII